MPLPPVADRADLAALCAALTAEDRDVALAGAVLRSGWENVVVETAEWIFRFRRADEHAFERELAILQRIQGRLPVATPRVEWTGERTRFAAYRKLTGTTFDLEAYLRASTARRDALAGSLAEFLLAMHGSLDADEIGALGIPKLEDDGVEGKIAAGLGVVPAGVRPQVEAVLADFAAQWSSGAVPGPCTLLHNDFHLGNLVLAGPVGVVSGVWDFSCVALGVPTFDLRYFEGDSFDLLDRLAARYRSLTGREIDLDAAVTANRAELIIDALDAGQPSTLEAAARRWRRVDADRADAAKRRV